MRYAAFISYSHRDRRHALWLHRRIERYRLPGDIGLDSADEAGTKLRPVFLDRAELPSSADLAAAVQTALADSRTLIVICSPDAAASRWVNEEVRRFKILGRGHRILCLVVSGDPAAGDCFPPALLFQVEDGQLTTQRAGEPLAADIRPGMDDPSSAALKIIAGMLEVPYDRLRQRDVVRRHRQLALIASASALGCVAFAALALVALHARDEAEHQRTRAEQQSLTAQRTADFMKSLFEVSDPGEARGNSVTAREVLDSGARQIDAQLRDAPLIRAQLSTTLGEVYANLGLYEEGLGLLQGASRVRLRPPDQQAETLIAAGELQTARADYPAARRELEGATAIMRTLDPSAHNLQVRLLGAYGELYNSQDDSARARPYFEQALALSAASKDAVSQRSRLLQGLAQADMADRRFESAERTLKQALAEQLASTGELHPRVSDIISDLGSTAYFRGQRDEAIRYYRRCLEIERRILGPRHPGTGPAINNLARMLLETRQFDEAGRLLEESIDIRKGKVLDTDEAMAFTFSNLALVRMNQDRRTEARGLFQRGLSAAILNHHRLHGPILADLADLECRDGEFDQGLRRLDEAAGITAAQYADDAWRMAHLRVIQADCLTRLQRYAEADALMSGALPVELRKWPADTMYGHDALERAERLHARMRQRQRTTQVRAPVSTR